MADSYSLDDVRRMGAADSKDEVTTFSLSDVRAMVEKAQPTFAQRMLKRETSDLSSNLRRGVRDVLDTGAEGLAWLYDKATGADRPTLSSLITGQKPQSEFARVQAMNKTARDQWLQENEGEILPHLQRLGGNVLGTLPVTSALGAGASAAGLPRIGNAISSGGISTGGGLGRMADLGTRTAGGAVNGYVSAGLVDPATAGTGAVIGGAAPGVLQALGAAGRVARTAYATRGDVGLARDIAKMGGLEAMSTDELIRLRDALRQHGPSLIPGAEPTVPQIMQSPGVSQLQRSVKAANAGALTAREAEQNAARLAALNRVAPVSGTLQQAAEEVGGSISAYAIPAEAAARKNVNALFDAVPSEQATMNLPLSEMEKARAKFLGPGTFGKGSSAVDSAIDEATRIGTRSAPRPALDYSSSDLSRNTVGGQVRGAVGPTEAQAVPFDQLQKLRSSINEAINDAERNGRNQAKAALVTMKNAIDNKVADVAGGNVQPGEVFTSQAIDAWGQALNAHAAKKLQFNSGPQAAMFRRGADGQPAIQGAEIPGKFFSSSRSQVGNAQSFRRLVADNPQLMGDLRRYAITDAAGQVDQFGNLTNAKFNRWLSARSGATGEIFNEQQRATLKAIADDLRRSAAAENLGRSTGSDTAQKAASMIRLSLLDHPGMSWAASHIPGGQSVLGMMRRPAQAVKAERLANMLVDPERVGGLLDQFIAAQQPRVDAGLLEGALNPALYRAAPLLANGE